MIPGKVSCKMDHERCIMNLLRHFAALGTALSVAAISRDLLIGSRVNRRSIYVGTLGLMFFFLCSNRGHQRRAHGIGQLCHAPGRLPHGTLRLVDKAAVFKSLGPMMAE